MNETARSTSFITGILVGGALGAAVVLHTTGQLTWTKKRPTTLHTASPEQKTAASLHDALDDEILSEQFTRNVQFFGSHGQQRVLDAFVVVVGLGVSNVPKTPSSSLS